MAPNATAIKTPATVFASSLKRCVFTMALTSAAVGSLLVSAESHKLCILSKVSMLFEFSGQFFFYAVNFYPGVGMGQSHHRCDLGLRQPFQFQRDNDALGFFQLCNTGI